MRLFPIHRTRSNSHESLHLSINDILEDRTPPPYTLDKFRCYVEFIERSVENLYFIEWYMSIVKDIHAGLFAHDTACELNVRLVSSVDTFISANGNMAINIPDNIRRTIMHKVKTADTPYIFEPAAKHILDLMQGSTVPAFIHWTNLQTARNRRRLHFLLWAGVLLICTAVILVLIVLPVYGRYWRLLLFTFIYWSIGEIISNFYQTVLLFTLKSSCRWVRKGFGPKSIYLPRETMPRSQDMRLLNREATQPQPLPKRIIMSTMTDVRSTPQSFDSNSTEESTHLSVSSIPSDCKANARASIFNQPSSGTSEESKTTKNGFPVTTSNVKIDMPPRAKSSNIYPKEPTPSPFIRGSISATSFNGPLTSLMSPSELAEIAPWTIQNHTVPLPLNNSIDNQPMHGRGTEHHFDLPEEDTASTHFNVSAKKTISTFKATRTPSIPPISRHSRSFSRVYPKSPKQYPYTHLDHKCIIMILLYWHSITAIYFAIAIGIPSRSKN